MTLTKIGFKPLSNCVYYKIELNYKIYKFY